MASSLSRFFHRLFHRAPSSSSRLSSPVTVFFIYHGTPGDDVKNVRLASPQSPLSFLDASPESLAASSANPDLFPVSHAGSQQEALSIVDRLIYFNHHAHYALWCASHGRSCGFYSESWLDYKENVLRLDDGSIAEEDQFYIARIPLSPEFVASVFRVASHDTPTYLPGEAQEERNAFFASGGTETERGKIVQEEEK